MRRFFIKLVIFLAPFLLGFIWVEHKLSSVPQSYSKKLILLKKNAPNIEVLVLGSSHAFHGIDPSRFHYTGFNMAQGVQSTYYDTRALLRWGPSLPRLKLVIFSASYFSLEVRPEGLVERTVFYSRYYRIWPALWGWQPKLSDFSLSAAFGVRLSIAYLFKGLSPDKTLDLPFTDTGWHPGTKKAIVTNQAINDVQGMMRVHDHEVAMDDKYRIKNLLCLQEALLRSA